MSDHIEVTVTVTLDDYRTPDVYRLETCNPLSRLSDAARRRGSSIRRAKASG